MALTGAGMSTGSGIPDYRGADGVRRATPMTVQQFRSGPGARRRYWARSYVGWPIFREAQPNPAHRALAVLEERGLVTRVVTQNVDGLHQAAGSRHVVDLHGRLDQVVCLQCHLPMSRHEVQEQMEGQNPRFVAGGELRPDGDVELPAAVEESFVLPLCPRCGSDLIKPDVVFFGESVPAERVGLVTELVDQASSLLVLGSSLAVMSGFRFVRQAHRTGVPVARVNRGWSRDEDSRTVHLDADVGAVLEDLVASVHAL